MALDIESSFGSPNRSSLPQFNLEGKVQLKILCTWKLVLETWLGFPDIQIWYTLGSAVWHILVCLGWSPQVMSVSLHLSFKSKEIIYQYNIIYSVQEVWASRALKTSSFIADLPQSIYLKKKKKKHLNFFFS